MNPDQLQAAIAAAHAELEAMLRDENGADLDGLTEEQERVFDRKLAELKSLADKHAAAQARLRMSARLGVGIDAPVTGAGRGAGATGEAYRMADGRTVRALKPAERLSGARMTGRDGDGLRDENFSLSAALCQGLFGFTMGGTSRAQMMEVGRGPGAGFLVPSILSDRIIDLARDQMILSRAGMETLDLSDAAQHFGSLSIATVVADPEPGWRGEAQLIPASDAVFGMLNIVPRSLAVRVPVTLELLADAPNIEALLQQMLAAKFAVALDAAGLTGAGFGPAPTGLLNAGHIPHGLLGAPAASKRLEYADLVMASHGLRGANAPGKLSAVYRPESGAYLETETDQVGQPLTIPPSVVEMNRFTSNSLPTVTTDKLTSSFIVGDFTGLMLVLRQRLVIDLGYSAGQFETGTASFRAILRADYAITRPGWFVIKDQVAVQ